MSTLSVCIVTKNEARNIKACLESVKFADEIIVIDSESTDNTVDICKQYTDKVYVEAWRGCGPQKKRATELASSEWILILDADERLSVPLQQEIQTKLQAPDADGYIIPFQTFYLGKKIRFGDWLNEKHLRLFKRDNATVVPRLVHFRIDFQGQSKTLKHQVMHYSFPTVESIINKMNTYSTDGAIHKQAQHKKAGLLTAIGHGAFAFIRGYILKLGFLDGVEGFLLAVSNAEGSYYRYLKLMYLNQRPEVVLPNAKYEHQSTPSS